MLSFLYILSHFIVFISVVETVQMWFFHWILMLPRSVLLFHVRLPLSFFINLPCTLDTFCHSEMWHTLKRFISDYLYLWTIRRLWSVVCLLRFLLFFPKATPTCYCSSYCKSSGKTSLSCKESVVESSRM